MKKGKEVILKIPLVYNFQNMNYWYDIPCNNILNSYVTLYKEKQRETQNCLRQILIFQTHFQPLKS